MEALWLAAERPVRYAASGRRVVFVQRGLPSARRRHGQSPRIDRPCQKKSQMTSGAIKTACLLLPLLLTPSLAEANGKDVVLADDGGDYTFWVDASSVPSGWS
jgi:hypothetical protein